MPRLLGLLACLLATALPAAAQQEKEVDVALVLAVDISGSIDPDEAKLQRQGYVDAFRDPVIRKAILGGKAGQTCTYTAPSGADIKVTIVSFEPYSG